MPASARSHSKQKPDPFYTALRFRVAFGKEVRYLYGPSFAVVQERAERLIGPGCTLTLATKEDEAGPAVDMQPSGRQYQGPMDGAVPENAGRSSPSQP
jgi:hypothetical protein